MLHKKEFLKIKIVDQLVQLNWQVQRDDESFDKYSLESRDLPNLLFYSKLQELKDQVNAICDLRLGKNEMDKLTITSIYINYAGKKHVMGASITALKTLPNRKTPLIINTPYLLEDYRTSKGDPQTLMPSKLVYMLYQIFLFANDYIYNKDTNHPQSKRRTKLEQLLSSIQNSKFKIQNSKRGTNAK